MDQDKKNERGRPERTIELEQVRELSEIGCTQVEAAGVLGIGISTFKRRLNDDAEFGRIWEAGRYVLNASLRRMQIAQVKRGSATMAIWLGKQLLGQRDKIDVSTNAPVYDFSRLSEEERAQFERIAVKLTEADNGRSELNGVPNPGPPGAAPLPVQ